MGFLLFSEFLQKKTFLLYKKLYIIIKDTENGSYQHKTHYIYQNYVDNSHFRKKIQFI